jgi:hypothetical protein
MTNILVENNAVRVRIVFIDMLSPFSLTKYGKIFAKVEGYF